MAYTQLKGDHSEAVHRAALIEHERDGLLSRANYLRGQLNLLEEDSSRHVGYISLRSSQDTSGTLTKQFVISVVYLRQQGVAVLLGCV